MQQVFGHSLKASAGEQVGERPWGSDASQQGDKRQDILDGWESRNPWATAQR